jgi:hypothetical protein
MKQSGFLTRRLETAIQISRSENNESSLVDPMTYVTLVSREPSPRCDPFNHFPDILKLVPRSTKSDGFI